METKQSEKQAEQTAAKPVSEKEGKEASGHNALVSFARKAGAGTHNALNSIAKSVASKAFVLLIAGLVVGILFGQLAMPSMGVGFITMPTATADNVDMDALKAKLQSYINTNLSTEGTTITVDSLEPIGDDLFKVNLTAEQNGQKQQFETYVSKDGVAMLAVRNIFLLNEPVEQPAEQPTEPEQPAQAEPPVVGTFESFKDSGYDIELQDGKPVIRLFSTTWCPHCKWIKETFDTIAKEYVDAGKIAAYHWELDTGDNSLTEEVETEVPASENAVYGKFNPRGSIPAYVFGGRYYRIGNGYEGSGDTANPTSAQSLANLAKEEAAFRAVIEELLK